MADFAGFKAWQVRRQHELWCASEAHKLLAKYLKGMELTHSYTHVYGGTIEVGLTATAKVNGIELQDRLERLASDLTGSLNRKLRNYYDSSPLQLSATTERLPVLGDKRLVLFISSVPLPDCRVEEREVAETVPAREEEVVKKTVRVAICTDPHTGQQTETVLGW